MARSRPTALQQATTLLKVRERTEQELRQGLARRGYAEAEVGAAVARLRALGYLDEQRVAEERARRGFAEDRSTTDVAARLARSGVEEAVIQRALDEASQESGHSDEAAARALLAKRKLSGAKAARFLASRGFEEDLIRRLLDLDET